MGTQVVTKMPSLPQIQNSQKETHHPPYQIFPSHSPSPIISTLSIPPVGSRLQTVIFAFFFLLSFSKSFPLYLRNYLDSIPSSSFSPPNIYALYLRAIRVTFTLTSFPLDITRNIFCSLQTEIEACQLSI